MHALFDAQEQEIRIDYDRRKFLLLWVISAEHLYRALKGQS
jgi:hypothetical protein